jgi:hypothetical protein
VEKLSDLIGYLVLIFIFVVLPAVLNRMAKKRAAQAQLRQAEEAPAERRPAEPEEREEARTSQVERYLEGLGIRVARKHAPLRPEPPPPPPTLRPEPPPPPPEGRTVYEARPVEVRRFLDELAGNPAAPPPPPPPRPRPVRFAAPAPRPASPAAAGHAVTGPPKPEAPAPVGPRARPLGVLGHRPTRSDLQKAVILGEVIRRPDFDRAPFEREIIP